MPTPFLETTGNYPSGSPWLPVCAEGRSDCRFGGVKFIPASASNPRGCTSSVSRPCSAVVASRLSATQRAAFGWRGRSRCGRLLRFRRAARHACAVLSGLTPEGGGRLPQQRRPYRSARKRVATNDYRYVWIRDQSYVGQAAVVAGADRLLDDAVRFVRERLLDDGPELKPVYTTSGASVPAESDL